MGSSQVMKNEWIWSPANIKGEDNYPQIYIAESTTIQNLDFHSYTMSELQNFVSCRIAFVLWLYISWEWHSEKIPDIVIGIKSFAKYIALKWPILLTFYPFFQKVLDCKLRKKSLIIWLRGGQVHLKSEFFYKGYGTSVITG